MRGPWLGGMILALSLPLAAQTPPRARFQAVAGKVQVGLLLPRKGPLAEEGEEIRRGAELALEHLPPGSPPLRLLLLDESQPWGAGSKEVVRLGFEEPVAAVIAGVSGFTSHLVEQIMVKAWVPFITPWASDSSLTRINIPWMFQMVPDDEAQTQLLLQALKSLPSLRAIAVVNATDFDSLRAGQCFARRAGHYGSVLRLHFAGPQHFPPLLQRLKTFAPDAVFFAGPPEATAPLVRQVRSLLPRARFLFPLRLFRASLRRGAGSALEGSWFAGSPFCEEEETSFHRLYRQRYRKAATLPAAYAYDTVHVLALALAQASGSREALRNALRGTNHPGVTGPLRFDGAGRRVGALELWSVRQGQWRRLGP